MGHCIHHWDYDEKVRRAEVMAEIHERARRDGDGYSSRFTWHDEIPPYETREKAEEAIKMLDRGWYDDHAVRYYDYSKAEKTAKMAEYEAKVEELLKAGKEYRAKHSVHTFKAKFIGCQKCGSKISKEYFTSGELCPVCRQDLRSQSTLEKIEWYGKKISDYRSRIEAEKIKQKKKAVIKWLVKFEYHT